MKTVSLTLPDGRQLDYKIRVSQRAKYMRLTFSEDKGLVVTQPVDVDKHTLNTWIDSKKAWISRHFDLIDARKQIHEQ